MAACTTGETPRPNPSTAAAAALPAPGSAPVPKKKGRDDRRSLCAANVAARVHPAQAQGPRRRLLRLERRHYHWDSTAANYTWLPGGFVERPYQGSVWTNGGWTLQDDQWGWTPGGWN